MRLTGILGLGLVMAACGTETPTSSGNGSASPPQPGAALAGAAGVDVVLVDVWRKRPDGSEETQQHRLVVEHSADGVAVSSVDTSGLLSARLRGVDPGILGRAPVAKGMLSVSGGAQLYDQAGLPVKRPDIEALREQSSLTAVSSRPAPPRGNKPAWEGPRRYVSRVVTAERAERQLASMRAHSDSEERVGLTQLRFHRTEGDVTQSWLFDEVIGAVVEATVDKSGRRHSLTQNEYQPGVGGHILAGSVQEWYRPDGQVSRRATTRFLAQ